MIIAVRVWHLSFREARAQTQQYDNERLGNCILIVGQVTAVGKHPTVIQEVWKESIGGF